MLPLRLTFYLFIGLLPSCAPTPRQSMAEFKTPGKLVLQNKSHLQLYESKKVSRKARPVIFVHGSPGKAGHWSRYLSDPELTKRFHLIAYDRPGFGQSSKSVKSLPAQIKALGEILQKQDQPAILVGHSLGGAIVLGAAARYPNQVHSIITIAPSVEPRSNHVFRVNAALRYSGLGWLLFPPWRNSHREVVTLLPTRPDLQHELPKVTVPVTIIQGVRDKLVPSTNIALLEKNLTASRVKAITLPNEGHFIPWRQFNLVKNLLLQK